MLLCMVADRNRAKAACGRAFASKSALESHVAFVDNSRTCRLCLTELGSMVALKGHTASHFRTGGERGLWLGCPLCSRSYKGINQMVQHMLHHDLPVRDMRLMLAMNEHDVKICTDRRRDELTPTRRTSQCGKGTTPCTTEDTASTQTNAGMESRP
jgi:hypothetical protein